MANDSKNGNYDKPELREKIKKKITDGDKGGKPGQWSARKAQLLTTEYEKAGGGYKSSQRSPSQKHLKKWTDEEWQTADGKKAEKKDGTTDRYLPKEAWDELSDAEKKKTREAKRSGSKSKQFVANTPKAAAAGRKARKASGKEPVEGYREMNVGDVKKVLSDADKRKLRSIKSFEEKNANRKGVLEAIDKKLA